MLGDAPVEKRYYFKQKPTEQEVRALAAKLPGGARELISTRSTKYRELGLDIERISEEQAVDLLTREPGLWRRPVVTDGDKVVIGYSEGPLRALLGR